MHGRFEYGIIYGDQVTCASTDASVSGTGLWNTASNDFTGAPVFRRIVVENTGSDEARIAIGQDSTSGDSKQIFIEGGDSYAADVVGTSVHYSAASGTPALHIQLYA